MCFSLRRIYREWTKRFTFTIGVIALHNTVEFSVQLIATRTIFIGIGIFEYLVRGNSDLPSKLRHRFVAPTKHFYLFKGSC